MLDPTGVRSKHQIRKTPTGCRGFLLPIISYLQNKHNTSKI